MYELPEQTVHLLSRTRLFFGPASITPFVSKPRGRGAIGHNESGLANARNALQLTLLRATRDMFATHVRTADRFAAADRWRSARLRVTELAMPVVFQ